MSLVLGQGRGRRAGLTRKYNGASLLQIINSPASQSRNTMPPRAVMKKETAGGKKGATKEEEEEDLRRLPESSEEDEEYDAGNIQETIFRRRSASEKAEEQRGKGIIAAASKKKGTATVNRNAAAGTRSRKGKISPASSQSNDSPKRKNQEEVKPLGAGMVDEWGNVKVKKQKRQSYGGRKTFKPPPNIDPDIDENSPKKAFKAVPISEFESPQKSDIEEKGSSFKRANISFDDSPATTPHSGKKFMDRGLLQTLEKGENDQQPGFKMHDLGLDEFYEGKNLDDSLPSLPDRLKKSTVEEEPPATQLPEFKIYFGDDDLIGSAQALVKNTERPEISSLSDPLPDDDDGEFPTMTQLAKCPMCGKFVDPAELREYGDMNTRQQERFCRSHQKKTARNDWELNGYPKIDWNKLDSRISKHHTFIRKLINGADSHYRDRLAETVNAGRNRSLMKSDFNPTPGYYGTRGLRAISENTMRKFTQLLKKRMVIDRLMAARGFTPYVEYVVVPEVAVLLIMEDMNVEAEKAREIMTESLGVGELLSEELREVVTRGGSEEIEDSDE